MSFDHKKVLRLLTNDDLLETQKAINHIIEHDSNSSIGWSDIRVALLKVINHNLNKDE